MAEEKSRKEFLRDMQRGSLDVGQNRIMDEMEGLVGYLKEWIAKCREGNVPAWVVYGQIHYDLWEVLEKLEGMSGLESESEGVVLGG